VISRGDYIVWERMWQRYLNPDISPSEQDHIIRALASTRLTSLQARLLSMSTNASLVRPQDRNVVIMGIAANRNGGRNLAWDFFRRHTSLFKDTAGIGDLIMAVTSPFTDAMKEHEVSAYFTTNSRIFRTRIGIIICRSCFFLS